MSKAPEAFRTISEVADLLRTPAHVLRFWESKFSQIKPVKRAGGRRYYRPADVALLAGIRQLLHDDGMTIRGVQKLLSEHGARHVAGLADTDDLLSREANEDSAKELPPPRVETVSVSKAEVAPDPEPVRPSADVQGTAPPAGFPQSHAPPPPPPADPIEAASTEPLAEPDDPKEAASPAQGPVARHEDAQAKDATSDPAPPSGPRIAARLRALDPGSFAANRAEVRSIAQRLDKLVESMAVASGAGRW